MRSIPILVAILAATLSARFAEAGTAGEFKHRGWTGFQMDDDPEYGCIAGKHVDENVFLLMYANDVEGFAIGVSDDDWELELGKEIGGAASFDDAPPVILGGRVVEPNIILFQAPYVEEEGGLEYLARRSNHVKLSFGSSWVQMVLSGSNRAIDLLHDCAEGRARNYENAGPVAATTGAGRYPFEGVWAETEEECLDEEGPNSRTLIDMKDRAAGPILDRYENHCRIHDVDALGTATFRLNLGCHEFWQDFDRGMNETTSTVEIAIENAQTMMIDGEQFFRCIR